MLAIIVILSLVTGGLSLLCPNKFDPQQTVHLAHPTSCSKFLTCVGDHPFEQRCPEGLHWNVERSYCDYPQLSECSRGELEYFDTIDFDPKVVANSVCLPQFNQCPVNSNPSEQVIFMKHRDCQKFYACVATQQVELSCPPNLYWNSSSCRCDYEIDAECDGTERVEEEIPQGADGEPNEPEESVDEDAAVGEAAAEDAVTDEAVGDVSGESQDGVVSEAEPEEVQEPEETVDDEVVGAEAEPQNEEDQEPTQEVDQSVDIVPNVRARRAADDEGTTTTVAATTTESATTVIDTTSTAAVTTTTSSGTTGSSGGGSSGPGSGGSVESGADVRTVSSIVMIVFTALMSVL